MLFSSTRHALLSNHLVMVSSELVVLLIVCVGINTGSAQGELATNTHTHTHLNKHHFRHDGPMYSGFTNVYCSIIIVRFSQKFVKMELISVLLTVLSIPALSVCPLH